MSSSNRRFGQRSGGRSGQFRPASRRRRGTPRRKISTKALAVGGASAAALAVAAPASANVGVYWYASACCQTHHTDSKKWFENYSAGASLVNWVGGRHNAGIWVCTQGHNWTTGSFTNYNCQSAFYKAGVGFPIGDQLQAFCWTGSNNVGGTTSHLMKCSDHHGSR